MSVSVDTYCLKDGAVEAMKYEPSKLGFNTLYEFTKGRISYNDGVAVIMEGHDAKRVKVRPGDYVVRHPGGAIYKFSGKEMTDIYMRAESV